MRTLKITRSSCSQAQARSLRAWNPALCVEVPGYELAGLLGHGATSAVVKARRERDGAIVAIKVLTVAGANEEDHGRFLREAETAASLNHPNVVRVLDHGHTDEHHYIVMEFVQGETVKARLARQGALPVTVALHIGRQIAAALEYAREHDVVHRDVKPENILVTEEGVAKLVDFGLAKSTILAGRSGVTRIGDVLGTLAYMPPEQFFSSLTADHRADVYSLGATLYHMIQGETAFAPQPSIEYFQTILTAEPPILGLERRDVPPAVSAMVAKCMRKRAPDRYQTAGEVERILAGLLANTQSRTTLS
jgi:serine/threonine protein kinase